MSRSLLSLAAGLLVLHDATQRTQPAAATRAGDDAFFLQARLACISVATVCFAAAGLEGQSSAVRSSPRYQARRQARLRIVRGQPWLCRRRSVSTATWKFARLPVARACSPRRIKEGEFVLATGVPDHRQL